MSLEPLPRSSTAVVSVRETGDGTLVPEEENSEKFYEASVNASQFSSAETRRASKWFGRLSLALFLGTEPLARPSPRVHFELLAGGSESAIYAQSDEQAVRESILGAVERVSVEELEDGMSYDLGMGVASAVERYHELALTTLAESIWRGELHAEVASHTLRWLGRLRDPATESSRLRLLTRSLKATSPAVRDGAALGLASLDRPEAIPLLRKAINDEPIAALRSDLEQVLTELDQRR